MDSNRLVEKRFVALWRECERNLRGLSTARLANARRLPLIIVQTSTDIVTTDQERRHRNDERRHVMHNLNYSNRKQSMSRLKNCTGIYRIAIIRVGSCVFSDLDSHSTFT